MTEKEIAQNSIPDKSIIEKEEAELERKNKWLYPTVIVVLVLFFVVGFIYGLNSVLSMEGAYPDPILTQAKTEPPADADTLVTYLGSVIENAKEGKPRFSRSADCRRTDDLDVSLNMEAEGKETLKTTVAFIFDDFTDHVKSKAFPEAADGEADPNSRDYFIGFNDLLSEPAFTADDVIGFKCNYIYYKCISCGKESDEPLDACEDCGSDYPYQMMYRDNYTFEIDLKVSDELIGKNFFPRTEEEIKDLLSPAFENIADITSAEETYQALRVVAVIDRATDDLVSLSYQKDVTLALDTVFKDQFAALGDVTFSLPLTETNNYNFSWPGLSLNLHTLSLEPKEKSNLLATLNCDAPTQYKATWVSSDPDVVAVDEDGYLVACKKDGGTATITASFDFNGHTYSDSCDVIVKYSVESMKLNKRHLNLSVNDTATLTAAVSPKKATIKTAKWYTSDDSIVTVDPVTGEITALAPGKATVYALSNDGAYKSSCEVTVK